MRWSEAGYLSRIVLTHAPRQASVSLIFDVRQNIMTAIGRALSILSLLLLVAPLPIAFIAIANLLFPAEHINGGVNPAGMFSDGLTRYMSSLVVGMFGFVTTGICIDGLRLRSLWFYRTLFALGLLWLLYIPIGSVFGICLIVYLLLKRNEFRNKKEA